MEQKIERLKKIINVCLYERRCTSCEMVDESAVLTCRKTLEMVLELLEEAVECTRVKRGRWECRNNGGVFEPGCTACGYFPGIRFWSSTYCPNCGAKMDEEEEK